MDNLQDIQFEEIADIECMQIEGGKRNVGAACALASAFPGVAINVGVTYLVYCDLRNVYINGFNETKRK